MTRSCQCEMPIRWRLSIASSGGFKKFASWRSTFKSWDSLKWIQKANMYIITQPNQNHANVISGTTTVETATYRNIYYREKKHQTQSRLNGWCSPCRPTTCVKYRDRSAIWKMETNTTVSLSRIPVYQKIYDSMCANALVFREFGVCFTILWSHSAQELGRVWL